MSNNNNAPPSPPIPSGNAPAGSPGASNIASVVTNLSKMMPGQQTGGKRMYRKDRKNRKATRKDRKDRKNRKDTRKNRKATRKNRKNRKDRKDRK